MKNLIVILTFLISTFVFSQAINKGHFDNITTNDPTQSTVNILKNVDVQTTGGMYVPSGTIAERPSPTKAGMLRYNSELGTAEVYSGSTWGSVGGGISAWVTSHPYIIGDVVIESNRIYKCVVAHTSGTFATDLAAVDWVEVSAQGDFVDRVSTQSIGGLKTFTSAVDAGANKITSSATPTASNDLVNKAALDAAISGLSWNNPILDSHLLNDSLSAPPAETGGVPDVQLYLVADAASGLWAGLEGRIERWDGTNWVDQLGRVVAVGDRFGVAFEAGTAAGGLAGKENYFAAITDANPVGGYAYTFIAPIDKNAVFVSNASSAENGHSYTYASATTTWIEFSGPATTVAGAGLSYSGTTLNIAAANGTVTVGVDDIKVADLGIANAQISNTASIARSKIATSTVSQIVVNDASGSLTTANLSGGVTSLGAVTTVVTNANLTGPITSSGNATAITSQTGTGTKFVVDNTPTLITPVLGVATGTSLALGGSINANAILDVQSTTKAFMPPRLTTTQKNAIASPTAGMVVYDSTLNAQSTYDGTVWQTGLGTITVDTDWTAATVAIPSGGLTFGTAGACTYRRVGGDLLVRCGGTATTSAALGNFTLPNSLALDTAKIPFAATTGNPCFKVGSIKGNAATTFVALVACTSTSSTIIYTANTELSAVALVPANGSASLATGQVVTAEFTVPISGWSSNGATYSAASANYSRRAYTPTFTGFGTSPTSVVCYESRSGEYNDIDCTFTSAAPTAVEGRMSLPGSNTSSANIGTLEIAGTWGRKTAGTSHGGFTLIEPSVGYITFSNVDTFGSTSIASVSKISDTSASFTNGQIYVLKAHVPISGWSNISQVVANISGYASVPGIAGSATPNVDHIMVSYGATINTACVTLNTNCAYIDQIGTGVNATSGVFHRPTTVGLYTINFNRTYAKMKCTVTPSNAATGVVQAFVPLSCANCASLDFSTSRPSNDVQYDSFGVIDCTGVY